MEKPFLTDFMEKPFLTTKDSEKTQRTAETIWKVEADESAFYISDPIFEEGSIELGVYALPNSEIINVRTLDELRRYKGVSSDN